MGAGVETVHDFLGSLREFRAKILTKHTFKVHTENIHTTDFFPSALSEPNQKTCFFQMEPTLLKMYGQFVAISIFFFRLI